MASGNITVYGGDFAQNSTGQYRSSPPVLKLKASEKSLFRETIPVDHLTDVDIYTQASAGIGPVGGAIVGEVLLGPMGALLGAALATRNTEVTFTATFKDGRRLFGKTDGETFARLKGSVFDRASKKMKAEAAEAAKQTEAEDRAEALVRRYIETKVLPTPAQPEFKRETPPPIPVRAAAPRLDAPAFGKRRS